MSIPDFQSCMRLLFDSVSDGQQLAELMIKHNLGVSNKETYQVKALDTDYFNED